MNSPLFLCPYVNCRIRESGGRKNDNVMKHLKLTWGLHFSIVVFSVLLLIGCSKGPNKNSSNEDEDSLVVVEEVVVEDSLVEVAVEDPFDSY